MGRNAHDERPKELNLQTLSPQHRGMARAQVAFGLGRMELAERFCLTPQQVSNITNSDLYKAELRRLEDMADRASTSLDPELERLAVRGLEIIAEDLYQLERSQHRTTTAFKVLDRAGYAKKEKTFDNRKQKIIIQNFAPLPGDDPEESVRRVQEARKLLGEEKDNDTDTIGVD